MNLNGPLDLTGMNVAPAQTTDARAIAEVHVRAWQSGYAGIVPAEYLQALSVDKYEQMWRGLIERGEPQILVAEEFGNALGWIAFGRCRDDGATGGDAEIWAIHVDPSQWRRQVGRSLCDQALARMRNESFRSVCLWVFPENARAVKFYESIGFRLDPEGTKVLELGGAKLREVRYVRSLAR